MPRIPNEGLIPRADKLLIRAFPKIAQRLAAEPDSLERAEMDAYLKLLPDAVARYQAVDGPKNDLHESVEVAISQLVTSFGSRNALAVEPMPLADTSNTSAELVETAGSVGESELPNGSDTDQSVASNALPHNGLEALAGSSGESSDLQARPRNARVSRGKRLSGRARLKLRQQELAESAGDQGRLSESKGGS